MMRYRSMLAIAAILNLTGCDGLRPEVTACENDLIGKLASPSSYKRISAESTRMDTDSPPAIWVSIEYDADNAYGAALRKHVMCKYRIVDGRADLNGKLAW